jgi:hypothetical protein
MKKIAANYEESKASEGMPEDQGLLLDGCKIDDLCLDFTV